MPNRWNELQTPKLLNRFSRCRSSSMLMTVSCCLLMVYLLPLITPRYHWLRYYICYTSFVTFCLTMSLLYIPLLMFRPKNLNNFILGQIAAFTVTRILDIEWEVRNKEILENDGKAIIVANHQSILDALGFLYIYNVLGECAGVAKKEIFYFWPFGLALWLCGVIFIDRNDSKSALTTLNQSIQEHLKSGSKERRRFMIFPEGTRNQGGRGFLPFKKGAFRLAIDFQLPVVPLVISPYYFIKPKHSFTGGKMIVTILEPIPTNNLSDEDVNELLEKTRRIMEEQYWKLDEEVKQMSK